MSPEQIEELLQVMNELIPYTPGSWRSANQQWDWIATCRYHGIITLKEYQVLSAHVGVNVPGADDEDPTVRTS